MCLSLFFFFFFPYLETLLDYKNTKKSWKVLALKDSVWKWEALDNEVNTQRQLAKWEQRYLQRMQEVEKRKEGKSSQGRLRGKQWVKEFWSFLEVLPEDWIRKGHGREIGKLSWSKRQLSPVLALSGEKRSCLLEIALLLFYFISDKHDPFFPLSELQ